MAQHRARNEDGEGSATAGSPDALPRLWLPSSDEPTEEREPPGRLARVHTVVRVVSGAPEIRFAVLGVDQPLIVGRDRLCDLVLDMPGLSRRHLRVALDDRERMTITDLGSTNGTWVDGRRLTEVAYVQWGARIEAGTVVLRLEPAQPDELAYLEALAERAVAPERDGLTGLATRRWLDNELANLAGESQATAGPATILFLDVDRFKVINDEFGHSAGDRALVAVARLVSRAIRTSDRAARYGGDEIVVILRRCSLEQASTIAERIRTSVGAHDWPSEGLASGAPSVSCGIAERRRGEPVEEWLERADRALYAAKRLGRNRVCKG